MLYFSVARAAFGADCTPPANPKPSVKVLLRRTAGDPAMSGVETHKKHVLHKAQCLHDIIKGGQMLVTMMCLGGIHDGKGNVQPVERSRGKCKAADGDAVDVVLHANKRPRSEQVGLSSDSIPPPPPPPPAAPPSTSIRRLPSTSSFFFASGCQPPPQPRMWLWPQCVLPPDVIRVNVAEYVLKNREGKDGALHQMWANKEETQCFVRHWEAVHRDARSRLTGLIEGGVSLIELTRDSGMYLYGTSGDGCNCGFRAGATAVALCANAAGVPVPPGILGDAQRLREHMREEQAARRLPSNLARIELDDTCMMEIEEIAKLFTATYPSPAVVYGFLTYMSRWQLNDDTRNMTAHDANTYKELNPPGWYARVERGDLQHLTGTLDERGRRIELDQYGRRSWLVILNGHILLLHRVAPIQRWRRAARLIGWLMVAYRTMRGQESTMDRKM